ncbi:hypothetical protein [Mycolicibacterium sphagni]|uniref:Uncharacterized protein n=1 Tax=Mycolicibacterium sphagni TaxID=1786 RepID=A0A255DMV3_9MYCO|nr:hypothetical protein [Mycolicibacterium sphagni]OYN80420.1 hypothetical protein CG716_09840 [Mycolicibacterium sphagni]
MAAKIAPTVTFEFEFVNVDGEEDIRELTMRSARLIPNEVFRQSRGNSTEATWLLLEWGMDADTLAWWDSIPNSVNMDPLMAAWQKASEVDIPKSEVSSEQ